MRFSLRIKGATIPIEKGSLVGNEPLRGQGMLRDAEASILSNQQAERSCLQMGVYGVSSRLGKRKLVRIDPRLTAKNGFCGVTNLCRALKVVGPVQLGSCESLPKEQATQLTAQSGPFERDFQSHHATISSREDLRRNPPIARVRSRLNQFRTAKCINRLSTGGGASSKQPPVVLSIQTMLVQDQLLRIEFRVEKRVYHLF